MSDSAENGHVIQLHDPSCAGTIAHAHVYLPFASGRLEYDCASCGAQCCRGHGYSIGGGAELTQLLRARPALALFVETKNRTSLQYQVTNLPPACFFLSDDGLCQVQTSSGYESKPETCRLFPFNNIARVGKYLVLAPHDDLCPLRVTEVSHRNDVSNHELLLAAASARGVAAPVQRCHTIGRRDDEVIAIERQIVELADQWPESGTYPAFTAQQVLSGGRSTAPERQAASSAEYLVHVAHEVLGTPDWRDLSHDEALTHTMVGMTPALRARMAFHSTTGGTSRWGMPIDHQHISNAMLSCYVIAESARRAGMQAVTFQSVSRLATQMWSLLSMLAVCDEVVSWQRGVDIDLVTFRPGATRHSFIKLAKALLPSSQRKRRCPLGELLCECAPAERVERVIFTKEVARCLSGKLVHIDMEPESQGRTNLGGGLRQTAYRWALATFDEKTVEGAVWR